MIVCKINVTRIDKAHLFNGKNGKYLDIALFENRDGTDEHGNEGFITQSVTKEAREAGQKGPIIGNWRRVGKNKPQTQTKTTVEETDFEDIPF